MCIATVFAPKVESGERVDVPKVKLDMQRVKGTQSYPLSHDRALLSSASTGTGN